MKKLLQRWLDVQPKCDHKCTCITPEQLTNAVNQAVSKYTEATCSRCGKRIFAHYGGFYRNAEGLVFCSTECVKLISEG